MNEKIEILSQALYFSPLLLIIACFGILHFGISWFISARKTKWKIDFWHTMLFLQFVFPLLFIYPFSASIYNFFAVRQELCAINEWVDKAAMISFIGYGFLWVGRLCHKRSKPIQLFARFTEVVEENLKNRKLLWVVLIVSLALAGLVIVLSDSFWDPRSFYLENGTFRPLYNVTLSIFPFALLFLILRSVKEKRRILLFFFFLFSIFLGVRGVLLSGLINLILAYAFEKKGNISLLPLAMGLFATLGLLICLDHLRNEEMRPALIVGTLLFKVFYGTTFSDIRDFAWILSRWDDEPLLWGKSYIAGFLSFVPRELSFYRQEWSFSIFTNMLLDFDSEKHPGLRPGPFGEAYFNFGLLGVIIAGWIGGYVLSYVDQKVKEVMQKEGDLVKAFSKTVVFFLISWIFSSQLMWSIYICLGFHLLLALIRRFSHGVSFQRDMQM